MGVISILLQTPVQTHIQSIILYAPSADAYIQRLRTILLGPHLQVYLDVI